MTTLPAATTTRPRNRPAGWAAIASGGMGIMSFAFLIACAVFIASQKTEIKEFDDAPLLVRLLFKGSYVGNVLQALFMIPVAAAVHTLGRLRSQRMSRAATALGISALIAVVVLRGLPLVKPKVSDILFIGPMGFVGVWLIVVNWLLSGVLGRAIRTTGAIVGIGFVIAGLSFFFLGGLAEFTHPNSIRDDLVFHIGLWVGGIPAFILYPVWAILLGRKLLRSRDHETTPSV